MYWACYWDSWNISASILCSAWTLKTVLLRRLYASRRLEPCNFWNLFHVFFLAALLVLHARLRCVSLVGLHPDSHERWVEAFIGSDRRRRKREPLVQSNCASFFWRRLPSKHHGGKQCLCADGCATVNTIIVEYGAVAVLTWLCKNDLIFVARSTLLMSIFRCCDDIDLRAFSATRKMTWV